MTETHERMKVLLKKSGLPAKDIKVFGSQIIVKCWSRDAADKWAAFIAHFAKVRGIVESSDLNQDQATWLKIHPGVVKGAVRHSVWLVGAYIK